MRSSNTKAQLNRTDHLEGERVIGINLTMVCFVDTLYTISRSGRSISDTPSG